MLAALGAAIAKDLRLLARDRAGLVFLALAPVVVITVAGFSLAGLFGAPPGGSRAYLLPVADEDGGRLGRALRAGLADAPALEMRRVADEEAARALVRGGTAGVALVIPPGASAAFLDGRPTSLLLYTDPVKYLEVANVGAIVQEARHRIEASARAHAAHRLAVYPLDGARAQDVPLPGIGTIELFPSHQNDKEVFFAFSGFTSPRVMYRLDTATGKAAVVRQSKLSFDPSKFETKQVFYPSKDGAKIPMSLVYRKGIQLDGHNPTVLITLGVTLALGVFLYVVMYTLRRRQGIRVELAFKEIPIE